MIVCSDQLGETFGSAATLLKSRADAKILVVTRTLRVSPRQRNSFAFFPSQRWNYNFFNEIVVCCKKTFLFLSFFYFLAKFEIRISYIFFFTCVFVFE